MADVRDKDLATEALIDAADDFSRIDGATNGTRKLRPANRGLPHYAPRAGIISAGTSPVGTTQDNTGLAFGTGNLTIGIWARLLDWTPSSAKTLYQKTLPDGSIGWSAQIHTDGSMRMSIGNGATANNYFSTVPNTLADGAWAFLAWTLDRAGSMTCYINGAQLGSPVVISALSAQTLTNTNPLYVGSSNGTGFAAGTFGECWIVAGLLAATDIANIYRAGSIRPFCTAAANTAAGYTAIDPDKPNSAVLTINGLSFYQLLDFGQGYGPIIRDRSGNNQHALMGTAGLTHAVVKNPPGIPQRAPKAALVVDGGSGSIVRTSLGSQNPGTGDVTTWIDFIFPTNSDANNRVITSLTNSTSDSAQGRSFMLRYNSPQGVVTQIYGATTADTRYLQAVSLDALLAGKRCVIVQRRSSTGIRMFIGIDGDFYDVTWLFQEVTAGTTPPAWTDQVDGSYLIALFRNSAQSNPSSIYDIRIANVAMTEAQLRAEYQNGEPSAQWQWGSKAALITGDSSTFTAGLGSWSAVSGSTVTAPSGAMVISNTASAGYAHGTKDDGFGWTNLMGKYVHMTFTHKLTSGALTGNWRIGSDNNIQPTLIDGTTPTFTPGAGVQTFDAILYVPMVAGGTANLAFRPNSGPETSTVEIDNITIEKVGYTARLRTDTAAGLTAHDAANKNDFVFSTTGVTTSPNGRHQVIRPGTLTFVNPGTLNLQLMAASCVDTSKKWRIVSVSGASNAAVNLSLGNVSAGAQYVNAQAVTAADFDISTFASRTISGANLWLASSNTATITNLSVILEETD